MAFDHMQLHIWRGNGHGSVLSQRSLILLQQVIDVLSLPGRINLSVFHHGIESVGSNFPILSSPTYILNSFKNIFIALVHHQNQFLI